MTKPENTPAPPGTGKTCPYCGKTQAGHRKGTITWWIFNAANCSCGLQNPAATVRPLADAGGARGFSDEDDFHTAKTNHVLPDLGSRYEVLSLLGEGAMGSV